MSDVFQNKQSDAQQNDPRAKWDAASDHLGATSDKARQAVHDVGDQASEVIEDLKGTASDFADTAKGFASDATDRLRSAAEGQKAAGADYLGRTADALRRAGGEFEAEIPQAAQYIRMAADRVEEVADAVRRKDLPELLGSVEQFARRQPSAFLLASVLTGFAVVRFLKTSSSAVARTSSGSGRSLAMSAGAVPQTYTPPSSFGGGDPGGISPAAPGFE